MKQLCWRGGALGLAVLIAAGPAAGAKLEKPECEALKSEATLLVTAGVRTDMKRGPGWAKANLAPERLAQVKRLIEIEEQLTFRCEPLKPPVAAKLPEANPPEANLGENPPATGKGRRSRVRAQSTEAAAEPAEGEAPAALIEGQLQPGAVAAPKTTGKAKTSRRAKRQPATASSGAEPKKAE